MGDFDKKAMPQWTRYSAGALEMGLSVVIGLGIGYWLDSVLGTAPWMALFWLSCGTFAGMRGLYRLAKSIERQDEESDGPGKGKPPA